MEELRGRRILVVEDEPIVAMTLEDLLEQIGVEVMGPVASVQRALAVLDEQRPDAALLDVNLGGERSDAVGQKLADMGVPFVVATGYGAAGYVGTARPAILDKPYKSEDVIRALQHALNDG